MYRGTLHELYSCNKVYFYIYAICVLVFLDALLNYMVLCMFWMSCQSSRSLKLAYGVGLKVGIEVGNLKRVVLWVGLVLGSSNWSLVLMEFMFGEEFAVGVWKVWNWKRKLKIGVWEAVGVWIGGFFLAWRRCWNWIF